MALRSNTRSKTRVRWYELGRTLGKGNFAKVKFARNVETGENFAIKVLEKEKVLKHKMIGDRKYAQYFKFIRHPAAIITNHIIKSTPSTPKLFGSLPLLSLTR
ncbi:hypothetical protein ACFX12_003430 [Malus domestica]